MLQRAKAYTAQKTEGDNALKSKNFFEAYKLYTKALKVDSQNVIMQGHLYFSIAQATYKLELLDTSLEACSQALHHIPDHHKALELRGDCYMDKRQYTMAVKDFEQASNLDSSAQVAGKLWKAKALLEAEKINSNPYAILEVPEHSSSCEINNAYQKSLEEYHPDRHAHAIEEEKMFYEQKRKNITAAYQSLIEPQLPNGSDNGNNNNHYESNNAGADIGNKTEDERKYNDDNDDAGDKNGPKNDENSSYNRCMPESDQDDEIEEQVRKIVS